MKFFISIAITLVFAMATFGQTDDKKAVLGVVNELFAQMRAANAAGILATGTTDNQLVAVRKLKDGKTRIDVINGEAFTKYFTKADAVEEVMYAPNVEISGDWAMSGAGMFSLSETSFRIAGSINSTWFEPTPDGRSRTEHRPSIRVTAMKRKRR